MKTKAEHFSKVFERCMKRKLTRQQAIVMSHKFSRKGLIDASGGYDFYVVMLDLVDYMTELGELMK